MKKLLATVLLSSALVGPTFGFELKLFFTGTEFDGMPAFEVKFGDTVLETGTLTTISAEGEEFAFDIPEEYADAPLQVGLTNDKYEQGVGDRNLRLVKAVVGGQEILPDGFTYESDGEPQSPAGGALSRNGVFAIANAPEGGWGKGDGMQPGVPSKAEAEAIATPAPAPLEAPVVNASAHADEPTEQVCETASISIVGFDNGSLHLSDDQKARIRGFEFAENCHVSVMGFSSTSGSTSVNQGISEARASAVADYLAELSDIKSDVAVVGEGETRQFGEDQASNRRVVIEAKPATP